MDFEKMVGKRQVVRCTEQYANEHIAFCLLV